VLVVGVGGSVRSGSSTEVVVRTILEATARRGAETHLVAGTDLVLPPYEPGCLEEPAATRLVAQLRAADALVLGSPGYHGSISGLVKNAIDYAEELRADERVYFDGLPVACVATAYGWQGAVHTLAALRDVVHALRGWPTPLGLAINSAEGGVIEAEQIVSAKLLQQVEAISGQLLNFAPASVGLID
jgi:FMN reductase